MDNMEAKPQRLHAVEDAFHEFLMRWAVDELIDAAAGTERICSDINRLEQNFLVCDPSFSNYRAPIDD